MAEEKIGALWLNEKNGKEWLSGVIGGKKVICFKNTYKKEGSKAPDWNVFPQKSKDELPPKSDDGDVPF